MNAQCESCGHVTHETVAVGRFASVNPIQFRAAAWPTPIRANRAAAERDVCLIQRMSSR